MTFKRPTPRGMGSPRSRSALRRWLRRRRLCADCGARCRTRSCRRRRPRRSPTRATPPGCSSPRALVLMMSIPGLALFYGGLVRTKNMLSVLSQVFMIVVAGRRDLGALRLLARLRRRRRLTPYIGGFGKAFLTGVTPASNVATFSNGVVIPELAYMVFQMTFAMITPALIVGAFAERIKFSALVVFIMLWVDLHLLPDRALGLVRGGPRRRRQCRQGPRGRDGRRGQDGGAGQARRRHWPAPAGSPRPARSTSPAARWCTSTPASPASSAA